MQLAFSLYKFTPFDGTHSDCLSLLEECLRRGHSCRLYCRDWAGEPVVGADILNVPSRGLSEAAKRSHFHSWVQTHLANNPADCLIGFNPMPHLNVYVASDLSTFATKLSWSQRHKAELKQKIEWQRQICAGPSEILLHSESQREFLREQFGLQDDRAHILPAGLAPGWRVPDKLPARRKSIRAELEIEEGEFVLLFVAPDLQLGGFDRALAVLSQMRVDQPSIKSQLLVIGCGDEKSARRQVKRAELFAEVTFLDMRVGLENTMCAADILIHPVREDHRGEAVLKALALGMPVVTIATCETARSG
jgi:UDP-glucose:(heptosyl)LPS alpha-1,3-glucosyltransferase